MAATADNGRRAVVVTAPTYGQSNLGLLRVLTVTMGSILINSTLFGLAAVLGSFITGAQAQSNAQAEVVAETKVEEPKAEPDVTNTDLGIDDTITTNYDVDRKEDVSVPGLVDPTSPPGVAGAPEDAIRQNVPAPPGTGRGIGASSGAEGLGAMPSEITGGMGGPGLVNPFGSRGSASTRQRALETGGGNARSERAVALSLQWLALHQANDGRWSLHEFNRHAREKPFPSGRNQPCNCVPRTTHRNDIAATALAVLPFLAGGITHRPSKEKRQFDYSKAVDAGLKYLIRQQNSKGYYGGDMYAHGMASIAMCEAYGLTSDPILKRSAEAALKYIYYAQDPQGGGWRYEPHERGDTSVTGWQLMAIKSGQMSGLVVPKIVLEKSKRFLDSVENRNKKGQFGYMDGNDISPVRTAVGLLCRMYGGINPRSPALINGVSSLKSAGAPVDVQGTYQMYYLYYATQVMHHMGGDYWDFWNLGMGKDGKGGIRDTLISRQDTGATPGHNHQIGSWESPDGGGRLESTALAALCLEVYYRHLPLYRRDMGITDKK